MDEWMKIFLKNLVTILDESIYGKIEVNYTPNTHMIEVKIEGPCNLKWRYILCETEMEMEIQRGYTTTTSVADAIIIEYKRVLRDYIFHLALK